MTQLYLDSANLEEIKEILELNILEGVTTNQKIFSREKGVNFEEHCKTILKMVKPFPVSIEGPNDADELLDLAWEYNRWGKNVVIKVPMLPGLDSIRILDDLDTYRIKTNATACMDLSQIYLAAKAGADYISLFYCRMKDQWGKEYALTTIEKAQELINEMKDYRCDKPQLIIGSIRHPNDVHEILALKPDIVTIPYKVLINMSTNSVTEEVLRGFDKAWEEFKKHELPNV